MSARSDLVTAKLLGSSTITRQERFGRPSHPLPEDEMRRGVVVEARDLAPARGAVELAGLGKGTVGVEPQQRDAEVARGFLTRIHQTPAEPQSARGGGDPETLDLGIAVIRSLQADTADRQ